MKILLQVLAAAYISAECCLVPSTFAAAPAVEFRTVDIFIDPHGQPLAAYQLDWKVGTGNARIVGIEGGEHPAFKEPPHYDPKAIQQERVIVAAFKVAPSQQLPKDKTRVARIHVQVSAGARCEYKFQRIEAATSDGRRISIDVSARENKRP